MKPDIRADPEPLVESDSWRQIPMPETSLVEADPMRLEEWLGFRDAARLKAPLAATEWYIECQLHGWVMLHRRIEVDPDRRGGVPILRGTGFTVAQLFAELAETAAIKEIAENFDLDVEQVRDVLNGFSLVMQRPYSR